MKRSFHHMQLHAVGMLQQLPIEVLVSVLQHLDKDSFVNLRNSCTLFKLICFYTQLCVGMRSNTLPFEEWRSRQYTSSRLSIVLNDVIPLALCSETLMSSQQLRILLELAVLTAKRLAQRDFRSKNRNVVGSLLVSPLAFHFIPGGFGPVLVQSSPVRIPQRQMFAREAQLLSSRVDSEEGDEDEEDEDGLESKLNPEYYNMKQDLLNRLVDTMSDQFTFCGNILLISPDTTHDTKTIPGADIVSQYLSKIQTRWITPSIAHHLYHHGFAVVDNFVSLDVVQAVYAQSMLFMEKTKQICALPQDVLNSLPDEPPPFFMMPGVPQSARGDSLVWLKDGYSPATEYPVSKVVEAHKQLGKELALLAHLQGESEAQLAFYPGDGTGYRRHRDAFPDDGSQPNDNRKFTAICYCNPSWELSHGGQLRVWASKRDKYQVVDLDPKPGRLMLFMSGILDHEVLPSYKPRTAITRWYW